MSYDLQVWANSAARPHGSAAEQFALTTGELKLNVSGQLKRDRLSDLRARRRSTHSGGTKP